MKQCRIFSIILVASYSCLCATEIELKERYYSLFNKTEIKKLAYACELPNSQKELTYYLLKKRPTFLPSITAGQLFTLKKLFECYQNPDQKKSRFLKEVSKISFKDKIMLLNFSQSLTLPEEFNHVLLDSVRRIVEEKPNLFTIHQVALKENKFSVRVHEWQKKTQSLFFKKKQSFETFSDEELLTCLWDSRENTPHGITAGAYTIICHHIKESNCCSEHKLIKVFDKNKKMRFSFQVKQISQLFLNQQCFAGISSYHQHSPVPSTFDQDLKNHTVPAFFIDLATQKIYKLKEKICFYDNPTVAHHQNQLLFFWPQQISCIDLSNGLKTILSPQKQIDQIAPLLGKTSTRTLTTYTSTPPAVIKTMIHLLFSSLAHVPFDFENLKTYTPHHFEIVEKKLTLYDYLKKIVEKNDTQTLTLS